MKKALQLLGVTAVFALFAITASSQRQIPLGVSIASPASGSSIAAGGGFLLAFTISNQSTTEALNVSDTLLFNISPLMDEDDVSGAILPAAIAPGGSLTLQIPTPFNNPNTGATPVTQEICITIYGTAQVALDFDANGNPILGGTWENPNWESPGCTLVTFLGNTANSVDESDAAANWSVYPNPANEQFAISTEGLSADATVLVHNSLGQKVYEGTASNLRTSAISTSEWTSGIYMVSVLENGVSHTKRLMIQH